ncbi:MAG: hypothetical protein V1924_00545 [Candidatus Bathyarchaeota archaeon]
MAEDVPYENMAPVDFEARLEESPIAYLPRWTLEWHGPNLPLGSDFQSQSLFVRLARRVGGLVQPPLFLWPDSVREEGGAACLKAAPQSLQNLSPGYTWTPQLEQKGITIPSIKRRRPVYHPFGQPIDACKGFYGFHVHSE